MTEMEELRSVLKLLRKEHDQLVGLVRYQHREREIIEAYLENLTSKSEWQPWEKRLSKWTSLWGLFHAWHVLYREPFSVYAADHRERTGSQQ